MVYGLIEEGTKRLANVGLSMRFDASHDIHHRPLFVRRSIRVSGGPVIDAAGLSDGLRLGLRLGLSRRQWVCGDTEGDKGWRGCLKELLSI